MHDLSVLNADELSPTAKDVFESLLGRRLQDDEELAIWASQPHEVPTGESRKDACRKLISAS